MGAATGIIADFAADKSIRVVVLTGAGGKSFVSGADISEFESERSSKAAIDHYNEVVDKANAAVFEFPKPTIAMIRGYCIGGGLGLAICCDMRICSDNSKFGIPAVKLGLGYGFMGVKRLVDLVGPSYAKEIFFTARQFDADEAQIMGLVNRVVPDAELESYVKNYADTICGNAPLTIHAVKVIVGEVVKDESERDLRMRRCWSRSASTGTTTSKAARPSWKSASRYSPEPETTAVQRPRHGEEHAWRPLSCGI